MITVIDNETCIVQKCCSFQQQQILFTNALSLANDFNLRNHIDGVFNIMVTNVCRQFFLQPFEYRLLQVVKTDVLQTNPKQFIGLLTQSLHRELRKNTTYKIHIDISLVLYRHFSTVLAHKETFHKLVGGTGNVDFTGHARGFHTTGDVNGVAPNIEGGFISPDPSGNDGTGMNTDAQFPEILMLGNFLRPKRKHVGMYFHSHQNHRSGWTPPLTGLPPSAIIAFAMVLILSIPFFLTIESKRKKK